MANEETKEVVNGTENNQQKAAQNQDHIENPEMKRGETPAPAPVEKYTQVTMPVWVAKALGIGQKIFKYALPVGIAAGSVFLGMQLGKNEEQKHSSLALNDLQNKLDRANADIALLEARANAVPELPQIEAPTELPELPSLNLETGEF